MGSFVPFYFAPYSMNLSSTLVKRTLLADSLRGYGNDRAWGEFAGMLFDRKPLDPTIKPQFWPDLERQEHCRDYPVTRYRDLCIHIESNPGFWAAVGKCHQSRNEVARSTAAELKLHDSLL